MIGGEGCRQKAGKAERFGSATYRPMHLRTLPLRNSSFSYQGGPMLTVGKMGIGRSDYYTRLERSDYQVGQKSAFPRPLWAGTGAERIGLVGEVDLDQFRNLFDGFSPDGSEK